MPSSLLGATRALMHPGFAAQIWAWLEPRADAVRADRYLGPAFAALGRGERDALRLERAAARIVHCDRSTLEAHCKALLGDGYAHAVSAFRLDTARELLRRGGAGVAAVAEAAGYDDVAVFRQAFKRRFTQLPSEVMRHRPAGRGHDQTLRRSSL